MAIIFCLEYPVTVFLKQYKYFKLKRASDMLNFLILQVMESAYCPNIPFHFLKIF